MQTIKSGLGPSYEAHTTTHAYTLTYAHNIRQIYKVDFTVKMFYLDY